MNGSVRAFAALSVLGSVLFVQKDAEAGVSNPDYYFIDMTDFVFDTPGGRIGVTGAGAAQIEGDIDNTGALTYAGSSFATGFTPIS